MILFQHIMHPLHTIKLMYQYINFYLFRKFYEYKFCNIRRGSKNYCWCGGELKKFVWHQNYMICDKCGCYVNYKPPLSDELSGIYTFEHYWHARQQFKGSPTIENRSTHDLIDGRVNYWLGLIEHYGPGSGQVIEVGCAHGILLRELRTRGFECIGIEPDNQTAQWVRENFGLDVLAGFFPNVALPRCDLFLAFDVIEHCPDPESFMKSMAELLKPSGIAIIQTPIDRYDFKPPFGEKFRNAFDDIEHLYIFTNKAMQELATRSGLQILSMQECLWLHHEVCVFQKL